MPFVFAIGTLGLDGLLNNPPPAIMLFLAALVYLDNVFGLLKAILWNSNWNTIALGSNWNSVKYFRLPAIPQPISSSFHHLFHSRSRSRPPRPPAPSSSRAQAILRWCPRLSFGRYATSNADAHLQQACHRARIVSTCCLPIVRAPESHMQHFPRTHVL